MLGDGSDSLVVVWRVVDGWSDRGGWVEELAAQVLQQAQALRGHGEPAPAAGGPVQDGPHKGQAAGLARQPADHLYPAAGFAEGAFDEVGVPDPAVVLCGEAQVAGELLAVGEQAANRRRVELAVLLGEAVDTRLDDVNEPLPGLESACDEVVGVEQRPAGVSSPRLGRGRAPWQAHCGLDGSDTRRRRRRAGSSGAIPHDVRADHCSGWHRAVWPRPPSSSREDWG